MHFIHFIRGSCRFQCVLPSQLLQWACNLHCLPKQARGMACDELQSLRLLHRRILGVPCQSMSCAVYAVTVSSGSKARARTCPPPLPHGVFLLLLQCAGREVLIQETLHEAWKYCEWGMEILLCLRTSIPKGRFFDTKTVPKRYPVTAFELLS